jgi:valyl-tRNA synthetase
LTNANAGEHYVGLDEKQAREKVLADLKEQGYFVRQEPYKHNVGTCYRCNTVIQPITSEQWFVDMKPLAAPAIKAVKDGVIKFVPKRFEKVYFNWMENIRDWCISRQLWWGHRIPVYYCDDCGEMRVLAEAPEKCDSCESENIRQDPDVLDTWFSSGLWPFSTLGWPEETCDLAKFYPNDVLVTGFDIIFLWVARMIVSGYTQMEERPFSDVIIHGLIRDAQGRKMSKSLGNGVDPLEVIEQYGADSLRLTVITGSKMGNDVRWNADKLEANKNFMNKLYNAAKFILMNSEEGCAYRYEEVCDALSIADKWIISKTNELTRQVTNNIDKYDLGIAADKLYDFSWSVFCDWYIELSKTALYNKEDAGAKMAAQYTLHYVFNTLLKLMHPFIPFVTEELFLALNEDKETVMIEKWPQYEKKRTFKDSEKDMEYIISAIRSVRNARGNMGILPSKRATMYLTCEDEQLSQLLLDNEKYFIALCSAAGIVKGAPDDENVISAVFEKGKFSLPLGELIDLEKERERLQGEKIKIEKEIALAAGKLNNEGFVAKAPKAVVEGEKYTAMLKEVEERIGKL